METKVYQVKGMSCHHCKNAVESAVKAIEGVTEATVDLEKGQVTVAMVAPVSLDAISAAVDDAGYELVKA